MSRKRPPHGLIQPILISPEVRSPLLPKVATGIGPLTLDLLPAYAERLSCAGIHSVALLGSTEEKSPDGRRAFGEESLVARAATLLRNDFPELFLIADLCICQYTTHGQCGLVEGRTVQNDATIRAYSELAVSYAHAGVNAVMPSGMMDGAVLEIRRALERSGYSQVSILAQSVKFASSLFAPFRGETHQQQEIDKSTYQLDPVSARQALREAISDIEEGADAILVKPAFAYLDILSELSERLPLPIGAFCTSGELSLIRALNASQHVEKISMQRYLDRLWGAGAGFIVAYFALEYSEMLKGLSNAAETFPSHT